MMTQTMTNNFEKCSKIKGLRVVLGGVRFPSAAEIKETAWLQGNLDFSLNRAVFPLFHACTKYALLEL